MANSPPFPTSHHTPRPTRLSSIVVIFRFFGCDSQLLENLPRFAFLPVYSCCRCCLLACSVIVSLILYRSTTGEFWCTKTISKHDDNDIQRVSETVFISNDDAVDFSYMFTLLSTLSAALLLVVRWTKASFEFERNTKSASAMYMKSERMRKRTGWRSGQSAAVAIVAIIIGKKEGKGIMENGENEGWGVSERSYSEEEGVLECE